MQDIFTNYNDGLMIELALTDKQEDFEQIIALQKKNHVSQVDESQWAADGFVTLEFDVATLDKMRGGYQHVIARSGKQLVGYSLVMLPECRNDFQFLNPMFAIIDTAVFHGEAVREKKYFVMGQICIDKAYRNMGIFRELYFKLRDQMFPDFDFVVTEVSAKNTRSVSAHKQIGFTNINDGQTGNGSDEWEVIAWDWK